MCGFTFSLPNCPLPKKCKYAELYPLCLNCYEKYLKDTEAQHGIECRPARRDYIFDFNPETYESCNDTFDPKGGLYIQFNFAQKSILSKRFNLEAVHRFIHLKHSSYLIHLSNLGGFQIDLGYSIEVVSKVEGKYNLINSKFAFYDDSKLVNSCRDLKEENNITSILQIPNTEITCFNCRFKFSICPLVFNNSRISLIKFSGLVDFYYKQNLLVSLSNYA